MKVESALHSRLFRSLRSLRAMPIIFGLIVSLIVVLGAIVLTWREEVGLFFSTEGYRPLGHQYGFAVGLFFSVWILVSLFSLLLAGVREDYKRYLNQADEHATPPIISTPDSGVSAAELVKAYYMSRGFRFHSFAPSIDASFKMLPIDKAGKISDIERDTKTEIWTKDAEQDGNQIYRRPGALIYPDGSATQFSVAVIYAHDVWKLGNERIVDRMSYGSEVLIEKSISRPIIRELLLINDYILAIGLASSKPTKLEERNAYLADARTINLGYAVRKLGITEPTQVFGVSLGYAKYPPTIAALEPRQRSVVLVGVNASRDVIVYDVLAAVAKLVTLDGVDLSNYSRPIDAPLEFRTFEDIDRYYTVEEVADEPSLAEDYWVLPAKNGNSK